MIRPHMVLLLLGLFGPVIIWALPQNIDSGLTGKGEDVVTQVEIIDTDNESGSETKNQEDGDGATVLGDENSQDGEEEENADEG
jgi:hypothetical protein